jgi:hypothetical protein
MTTSWWRRWLGTPAIPNEVLGDADPKGSRVIWSADLAQWDAGQGQPGTLRVARVSLPGGGVSHRAYIVEGRRPGLIGTLARIFPNAPLTALVFSTGSRRILIGHIDDAVPGTLDSLEVRREEPNRARWMAATKISTIKERVFLLPFKPEEYAAWSRVSALALKTRESLAENWRGKAPSAKAWAIEYDPPMDLGVQVLTRP